MRTKNEKYIVVLENDYGYMDCVAICDNEIEAYGKAFLALTDGLDEKEYYVTPPYPREGENGYVIAAKSHTDNSVVFFVTVLEYREEDK